MIYKSTPPGEGADAAFLSLPCELTISWWDQVRGARAIRPSVCVFGCWSLGGEPKCSGDLILNSVLCLGGGLAGERRRMNFKVGRVGNTVCVFVWGENKIWV